MKGRELDLYDGVDGANAPAAPAPTPARGPAPGAPMDWIAAVWAGFPAAVRERYRPRAEIGEGGMGVIVEAHDLLLDRVVALKGVRDPAGMTGAERARRGHEARLAARLTHPNILPVYDTWQDAHGNPWCSMLRVPGPVPGARAVTLATRLDLLGAETDPARRPLPELFGLFLQVCRAVSHAHERGIVHRDLKPANVLLGPTGEALVADWGVAWERGSPLDVAGTPGYAAPEQVAGPPRVDERSDVYALGVVLAEILGRKPGARRLSERVPRELAAIVARATAPAPEDRFDSVAALQRAVEAHLGGGLVEGLAYGPRERLAKWVARKPARAVAVAAFAAFVLLAAAGLRREAARKSAAIQELMRETAMTHAAAAAAELAAGRRDEARVRAALATQAAGQATEGFQLTAVRATSALASTQVVSPLAWACRFADTPSSATFSADGRELFVATKASTMVRLDLADTRHPRTTRFDSGAVFAARVSPDARWFVTGNVPFRFAMYDLATEKRLPPLATSAAAHAAFTLRSDRMALITTSSVTVHDLPSRAVRARLGPMPDVVWTLEFSPDGSALAVASAAGTVTLWPSAGGSPITTLPARTAIAMAFDTTGRWLYTGGDAAEIRRWDLTTGREDQRLGPELANTLHLTAAPDGRCVASSHQDGIIRLWDSTGRERARLAGHTTWVWHLAFSPDGRWLASTSDDGTVRLWDVDEALRDRPHGRAQAVTALAFAPDSGRVASAHADGTIVVRGVDGRIALTTRIPAPATAIALGARGELTALSFEDGRAVVRDFAGAWSERVNLPVKRTKAPVASYATPAALSADGRTVVLIADQGPVIVRDRGAAVPVADAPGSITSAALSDDGARVALGAEMGLVGWADTSAPRFHPLPKPGGWAITAVALSPRGDALTAATMGQDGSHVALFDVSRNVTLSVSRPHLAPVRSITVTRDRRRIISGAPDGIRLSDTGGKSRRALDIDESHAGVVRASPDGRLLAWSTSAEVEIWDLAVIDNPVKRADDLLRDALFDWQRERIELVPRLPEAAPPPRWRH